MKNLTQHAQSLRSIADAIDQQGRAFWCPKTISAELAMKAATLRWIADDIEKPENRLCFPLAPIYESALQEAREILSSWSNAPMFKATLTDFIAAALAKRDEEIARISENATAQIEARHEANARAAKFETQLAAAKRDTERVEILEQSGANCSSSVFAEPSTKWWVWHKGHSYYGPTFRDAADAAIAQEPRT